MSELILLENNYRKQWNLPIKTYSLINNNSLTSKNSDIKVDGLSEFSIKYINNKNRGYTSNIL